MSRISSSLSFLIAVTVTMTFIPSLLFASHAQAQTIEHNHFRMIWTAAIPVTSLRDFAQSTLGGYYNDFIIFHYCPGCDPTQAQIDAMKAVTVVPNIRKGFEFFSLAEMQEWAPTVKSNGLSIIAYDLEPQSSPQAEVDDPVGSVTQAKAIAKANGLTLQIAPSHAISSGQYADDIAAITNRYHLQSQPKQDDDTTCNIMKNWVADRVSVLEGAQSALETKISFQVTLTSNAAPGKTIYQTAKDCIDAVANDDVDGLSIWCLAPQWNDHTCQDLITYYEDTYSS